MLQTYFETKADLVFPSGPIHSDLFVRQYGRTRVVTTDVLWGVPSIDLQVPIPIYAPDGTVSYRVETRSINEVYVKRAPSWHYSGKNVEALQREAKMAETVLKANIPWAIPLRGPDGNFIIRDQEGNGQLLKVLENDGYFGSFPDDLDIDNRMRLMKEDIMAAVATQASLLRAGMIQMSMVSLTHGIFPWYWNDGILFAPGVSGPGEVESPNTLTQTLFEHPNCRRKHAVKAALADAEHILRINNPFDYVSMPIPICQTARPFPCLPFGHTVIEFLFLIGVKGLENHFLVSKIVELENLALERFYLGLLGTNMPEALWQTLHKKVQDGVENFDEYFNQRPPFKVSISALIAFHEATKLFTYAVRDEYRRMK